MRFRVLIAVAAMFSLAGLQAKADTINLFESDSVGTFVIGATQTRSTYFEVLGPVRITGFGAIIDPSDTGTFTWNLLQATQSAAFGGPVLFSEDVTYGEFGLLEYGLSVDLFLNPGFYTLQLQPGVQTNMLRFNEFNEDLPFIAGDLFRVLEGGANRTVQNSILPSFSIDAEAVVSAVPLPAALPLLATALGGLGFLSWRRNRSRI